MNDDNFTGTVNRTRKDTIFALMFGRPENRHWTLELYNAVNGSNYTDPDDIEINTLENALYMGVKNDVSFILDFVMNIYEHQSTFNPNMPLRQLEYAATLYREYISKNRLDKFSSSRLTIPLPKLIVFYNGKQDEPEETILHLSDLFPERLKDIPADIEVHSRMLNINYGHNKKLLEACAPLKEYAWAVETERKYNKTMSIEQAVAKTLEEMPDDFVIKPFLTENRDMFTDSFLSDYDEELHIQNEKELSWKEGDAHGLKRGLEQGLEKGLKQGAAEREALAAELAKYKEKFGEI
ncbi:MAG: hypothetical protein K5686_05725 [Lachnospiraceae bacterium]|nr:hypothetical protein [Lachnospiraceae bacterium]